MQLTAVFQKVPEGYIGFLEEIPGVNTQGDTLEEARENLQEALTLIIEANRHELTIKTKSLKRRGREERRGWKYRN